VIILAKINLIRNQNHYFQIILYRCCVNNRELRHTVLYIPVMLWVWQFCWRE